MIDLSKRPYHLIKIMLSNQDYKTVKYYSDLMNVSQRTLHNDLKVIEKFINHFDLMLKKKPSIGIKISGEMKKKLDILEYLKTQFENEEIQELSPLDRKIQITKMLLIEEKVLSYQGLSELFFVSKSSIAADMEKIQSELNGCTVKIKGDQKGTYITGTESQIQYSLKFFNEELFKVSKVENNLVGIDKFGDLLLQYYPSEIVNSSFSIVKKVEHKSAKLFAEHYLTTLFNTIIVLCYRASKKKHHSEVINSLIFDEVKNLKTYLMARDILDDLQHELSITFTTEDTIYLNQYLIAIGIESSYHPTSITEEYIQLVEEIIQKMSSVLKVDLSNDKKLFEGLVSHIIPMIYRLRAGITVKNPLLTEIKDEYSVMLGVSWFVTSIIEEAFEVNLTEDEVAFILVHFQAALERNSSYKRVLIVCPNGIGTSELIANKVKHILPALCLIEVVPIDKLYQMNIDSVDFIISAIPIRNTTKPVIYVSPLVTSTDVKNIMNFYTDLFLLKEEKKEPVDQYPDIKYLSKFIKEDSIFINKKIQDQKEVLSFLIQKLKDSNDIISGFEESVYNRENVGTTALDTGVAIPHGTPKFVVNTRIIILTTEDMIDWGGTKVDTVILICISPKDLKNVKNILSDIYKLIESRKNVKKYFSDNTGKGILQLMKEGDKIDPERIHLFK
ncbi:transcription antiterminator [Bacillus sp. ISL-75]|uniref:BglG family transcription antiterminator n=1 Tax=Bacillus sp. ISL-75 TaxID=2819137 RepID=UPI001BECD6D6|nr:BglG family transcription antiterminator [Bacillus sp. ISL-75]MBT2729794.1 transcription antiterminator [Bacillus sp. ISL-75]